MKKTLVCLLLGGLLTGVANAKELTTPEKDAAIAAGAVGGAAIVGYGIYKSTINVKTFDPVSASGSDFEKFIHKASFSELNYAHDVLTVQKLFNSDKIISLKNYIRDQEPEIRLITLDMETLKYNVSSIFKLNGSLDLDRNGSLDLDRLKNGYKALIEKHDTFHVQFNSDGSESYFVNDAINDFFHLINKYNNIFVETSMQNNILIDRLDKIKTEMMVRQDLNSSIIGNNVDTNNYNTDQQITSSVNIRIADTTNGANDKDFKGGDDINDLDRISDTDVKLLEDLAK